MYHLSSMALGLFLGIAYVGIIFHFNTAAGTTPVVHLDIGKTTDSVYMKNGSLYIFHRHVHHWMIYMALLPIFVLLQFYIGVGFCLILIIHGLSYSDAMVM